MVLGTGSVSAAEEFDTDPKHQLSRPDTKAADKKKLVKVFILLGQSNVVGVRHIGPETNKSTLACLTKKEGGNPFLIDDRVKAVDSRDLWRQADVSPKNQGHHNNRNAETYMETGLRLITADDLKDFWRSDHYGALSKGVLSRPAFVIENP